MHVHNRPLNTANFCGFSNINFFVKICDNSLLYDLFTIPSLASCISPAWQKNAKGAPIHSPASFRTHRFVFPLTTVFPPSISSLRKFDRVLLAARISIAPADRRRNTFNIVTSPVQRCVSGLTRGMRPKRTEFMTDSRNSLI